MARIVRFSGYFVDCNNTRNVKDHFCNLFLQWFNGITKSKLQQFHTEESESFELDGEDEENCDLALLTRHFKKDTTAEFDRPLPKTGEKYRHFKIGKIVTVIGVSRHTETEELSVVYDYEGHIWNRPLDMFMSEVDHEKYPNVTQKYRFEKVEE